MAGQGPVLTALASLVSGFDEATWEALANKGLVRRARKDLESGLRIDVEETGDSARFRVPPYEVVIPPAGPAKATCTCPARGVCQHILAAGMWLQTRKIESDAGETTAAPSGLTLAQAETEVLAITMDQLQKWAGVGSVREARLLAASGKTSANAGGVLVIEFPDQGVQVRYTLGCGLDGMIVSGTTKGRQQMAAVAAVLCIHLAHGKLAPEVSAAATVLEEVVEAPRTRSEILAAAQATLEEAIQVGLAHVSGSLKDRLQTLGMSAQATNLPRLSRMLRGIADETEAIITRQGKASEASLLLAMARAYALVQALLQPEGPGRTNLVGVHRTRYQELARLELTGVAAHPWQTPSGFIGLTALYWDQRGQSWVSWSDARPLVQAAGFDPLKRFRMNGPWEGVSSPEETVLNKIVLVNPKRNPDGRLSSSTSTKAMVLEPVRPSEIDFGSRLFSDWGALRSYVAGVFPLGLRETHPLDLVVVIQPHRFGPRSFDEQRQLFRWEVRDRAGASFLLAIPYSPWTKQAIKCLEELEVSDKEQWRIVSKITSSETGLVAEPLTLHKLQPGQEKLIHLAFTDDSSAKSGSHSLVKTLLDVFRDDGDEWDEVAASDGHVPAHLDRVITKIEREVERAAESGADSLNWPLLESMQRECERLSLMPLAQSMKENRRTCSRALLGIRYTSSLYRQSASFA